MLKKNDIRDVGSTADLVLVLLVLLVPTGAHCTGTNWYPLVPTGTHWYPLVLELDALDALDELDVLDALDVRSR